MVFGPRTHQNERFRNKRFCSFNTKDLCFCHHFIFSRISFKGEMNLQSFSVMGFHEIVLLYLEENSKFCSFFLFVSNCSCDFRVGLQERLSAWGKQGRWWSNISCSFPITWMSALNTLGGSFFAFGLNLYQPGDGSTWGKIATGKDKLPKPPKGFVFLSLSHYVICGWILGEGGKLNPSSPNLLLAFKNNLLQYLRHVTE